MRKRHAGVLEARRIPQREDSLLDIQIRPLDIVAVLDAVPAHEALQGAGAAADLVSHRLHDGA